MTKNHEILRKLNQLEQQSELYDVIVEDIPLWRIVRFKYRVAYLNEQVGFKNKSEGFSVNKLGLLKYFVLSFFQYTKMLFSRKKSKNIVFAFPRLYQIGHSYIDKFTDPVIENSDLKDSTIIFQHSFGRPHYQPRHNNKKVIYSDFVDIVSKLLAKLGKYYIEKKHLKQIKKLHDDAIDIYKMTSLTKSQIAEDLAVFLIYRKLYTPLFNKLKPKNIFIVSREVFKFALYLGHKNNCKVFEFQHGITESETAMYSGPYQPKYDPHFFLTFGEAWKNNYYGIPENQIYNIGWAYREYVQSCLKFITKTQENTFLVISSPSITQKIINFVLEAKEVNSKYAFNIRLHPQEKLTLEQQQILDCIKNINILNNEEESIFSIAKHTMVLGEHSSVLYEALSMGKKVGKLNMFGMYSRKIEEDVKNGFFIIKEFEDLDFMFHGQETCFNNHYYSDFNKKILNQLIK